MNIVIVGAGSIGKRHLNNLIKSGEHNITVISRVKKNLVEFTGIVCKSFDELTPEDKFDAGIICTPTSLHTEHLQTLLNLNVSNIYIEKPISNSYKNALCLYKEVIMRGTKIRIGYDLRYDPGLQKVKGLIADEAIGKIISVNAFVGQYLPDWRPAQDYKKSMSAKLNSGGGVLLDLAHEFDYLLWLFGEAETIACNYCNTGTLDIETEDVAEVLLKFKKGIIGNIHLDYLQPKLVRNCRITGSKGIIYWDIASTTVCIINNLKEEYLFDYKGFERNDRFIDIMNDFIKGNDNDRTVHYNEGLKSLKMIEAAKYSSEHDVFVKLDAFLN